jgi:hypothetical protein
MGTLCARWPTTASAQSHRLIGTTMRYGVQLVCRQVLWAMTPTSWRCRRHGIRVLFHHRQAAGTSSDCLRRPAGRGAGRGQTQGAPAGAWRKGPPGAIMWPRWLSIQRCLRLANRVWISVKFPSSLAVSSEQFCCFAVAGEHKPPRALRAPGAKAFGTAHPGQSLTPCCQIGRRECLS